MTRTPIWKSIAETLRHEIGAGSYRPGDKLPTEAALATRFGVNRHTVRHALADLADTGLVRSRRGAGTFVAQAPTDYPIGKRVRYRENLRAAGRAPGTRALSSATRLGNDEECDALQLAAGSPVHVFEGLMLGDGQPYGLYHSVFPAARFPTLPEVFERAQGVTAALRQFGVEDYTRAWTRLTALRASATQALHLEVAEGAPLLRSVGLSIDSAQRPVQLGRTWFAGDRITLTLSDSD